MGQYENGVEGQMKTAHRVNVRRFFHLARRLIKPLAMLPIHNILVRATYWNCCRMSSRWKMPLTSVNGRAWAKKVHVT